MKQNLSNIVPISTLLALGLTASGWAASPVAIANAGFEDPVLGDNGTSATVPDWTAIAGGGAAFNPTTTQFTSEAPEGANVASFYEGAVGDGLSQVLAGATGQLQADATYALTVKVGDAADTDFDGYKVQLLANGTVLAEDDNTVAAVNDDFVTSTVNYVYNAGLHAGLVGEALEIRLLTKDLGAGTGDTVFDDVQLTVTLTNPVGNAGGPYTVQSSSGSLSLDGSGSLPSDGETITTYEWDLNNDNTFGDVTGVSPAAISSADLQATWGMTIGANTIQLRVTDSATKTSTVSGTVILTALPTPVAYWPMRDGLPGDVPSGSGAIDDVIDNAANPLTDGTPNNSNSSFIADPLRGIVWSTVEGNRVTAGQQGIDLNTQSGWTWALWANINSSNLTDSGADVIMGSRNATWNKLDISGASNWINPTFGAAGNPANDTWQHIVFVGDASGGSIYVNGVLQNTDTSFNGGALRTDIADDPMEIGGSSRFSEDVTGLYSDVAVWDVALSPSEIADLANGANVIADATAPFVVATTPEDEDTNASSALIQAIFDEPVVVGSGDIRIVNDTDTVTTTIDVTDAGQVTVSGANIVINPSVALIPGKAYHIEMDAGVVTNVGGLDFGGINDSTTWNFFVDNTPPTLVSMDDDVSGGPLGEDDLVEVSYTVTFNEPMDASSIDTADFDNAGTAAVSITSVTPVTSEVFTVVVTPSSTGTLQLRIPSGAVVNDASGNALVVPVLDDTTITINAGTTPNLGQWFWDGGTTDDLTQGDGVSGGGNGTWDATTKNWDRGPALLHGAWIDDTANVVNFDGSAGTVALDGDFTLGELVLGPVNNYFIGDASEDNTLSFGGAATITLNGESGAGIATIRTGITGSPVCDITARSDNNANHFSLLPGPGVTMTLGSINMSNANGSNKSLILGGESTGNVADAVTWTVTNNQLFVTKIGTGDWTINNSLNIDDGRLYVEEGTLTILGTDNFFSHKIGVATNKPSTFTASNKVSKLVIAGDLTINDNREWLVIQNLGTLSPGNGVSTLNLDWIRNNADDAKLWFQNGSTYEWELGAANASDVINITKIGGQDNYLQIDATSTLKVVDVGGTPLSGDQLTVFTYDVGVTTPDTATLNANMTIDISGTSYTGTPSFVNDGAGTIYITGLSGGAGGNPFDTWAGTGTLGPVTFDGDTNGDGVQDGMAFLLGAANPDDDANGRLPSVSEDGSGNLVMQFNCLPSADRGTAELRVSHSNALASWTATVDQVPDADDAVADNDVTFVVVAGPAGPPATNSVTATIDSAAAAGGKLFGRLEATE